VRAIALLLISTLFLAACAGSSRIPMRHYLLEALADPPAASVGALAGQTIIVGPLSLPGYLDRPQLMIRLPDGELKLRDSHRWAEPLDALLTRTLAENLGRLTASERVVTFPVTGRVAADWRVTGRIIRFDSDADGLAVLRVQWSIADADGSPGAEPLRVSEYRQRAASADEAAMVLALSETVALFAADLAGALTRLAGE